jgi:bisphosphoglycerate-dependent phosphoglycerate mutase
MLYDPGAHMLQRALKQNRSDSGRSAYRPWYSVLKSKVLEFRMFGIWGSRLKVGTICSYCHADILNLRRSIAPAPEPGMSIRWNQEKRTCQCIFSGRSSGRVRRSKARVSVARWASYTKIIVGSACILGNLGLDRQRSCPH